MRFKLTRSLIISAATAAAIALAAVPVPNPRVQAASTGSVTMYRMYNEDTHEHLYTADANERNVLAIRGWDYEGVCWTTPESSDIPVYRMFNPATTDHLYTTDLNEYIYQQSHGWQGEGIGWYAADSDAIPVYRQFSSALTVGSHNYTTDINEKNYNASTGAWRDEGIAWYCLSLGHSDSLPADIQAQVNAARAGKASQNTTQQQTPSRTSGQPAGNSNSSNGLQIVQSGGNYVVNLSTRRFHTQSCRYSRGHSTTGGDWAQVANDRSSLISLGYSPCGVCKP